ncbi:hypothetical protein [Xanthomarina spongicola]|jgi:hypothetical protein|uniref:DUF4136 domain-containing protein n=1 Tax=Xanthomarina spongicola TaxID=570520 RepID=A0A316DNR5_9FLAO|nr:hypothetical protein [Xanthomarina spongicola]PWK19837.1 hypothetical protein LX78_01187 [Xanthomarina spongicola]
MKNTFKFICTLALIIIVSSCSSIKVVDSWKSDTASSIKDNNILVIARTQDKQARIAFEQAMANQMRSNGIKATESFRKFPNMLPDEKLSEEKLKNFEAFLNNEGYDGIVLTVVKDMRESTQTTEQGGYYAGASYSSLYPSYYGYGGFYGYYAHPMAYSTYGSYTPSTYTTTTVKTFIVETVIYDLEQPKEEQLVAVVTSQIEDPQDVTKNAEEYTKKVAESLNSK